jgi:unsaturated rhamnogalacturonyl hydrolase
MMERKPLEYAKKACDTMMRKHAPADLPPKGHFHYHQGVFLSGMLKTYATCGDERYFDYVKGWVDSVIGETGAINDFCAGRLDDIQPGILLYSLLDRTGDARYQKALDALLPIVLGFPRNPDGGLWHMDSLPNQMWLDGLYMAGPICAEYAKRYGKPEYMNLVIQQALLMESKTKDEKTGLFYHAWDYDRKAEWADPATGRSPEFWGRSIGWVLTAVLDDLDFMDAEQNGYGELCALVRNLLAAVCRYQSEDGRWYQVVNKAGEAGNWRENSCSCLYTAALYKAMRKKIIDGRYMVQAAKGFQGVTDSLGWEGDDIQIGNVCIGTGVGDYRHYCARPVSVNDLHGVGAFLLMCAEAQLSL